VTCRQDRDFVALPTFILCERSFWSIVAACRRPTMTFRRAHRLYSTSHVRPLALSDTTPVPVRLFTRVCFFVGPARFGSMAIRVWASPGGNRCPGFRRPFPSERLGRGCPRHASWFSADRSSPAVFHVGRSSAVAEPPHDGRSRADLGEPDCLGGLVRAADAPQRMNSQRCA